MNGTTFVRRFATSTQSLASYAPGSQLGYTVVSPVQAVAAAAAKRKYNQKTTKIQFSTDVFQQPMIQSSSILTQITRQQRVKFSIDISKIARRGVTSMVVPSVKEVIIGEKYVALSSGKKRRNVPAPRGEHSKGEIKDVKGFLSAIGRKCEDVADKFATWDELFTIGSNEMTKRGINIQQKKYILKWIELYRRGHTLEAVEKAERQRKYRKLRWAVKQAKIHREGLSA
ncbi:telomere length regulation protein [Nowakowskiella sp. JEL0078]|nr:telomere length regulation protein [Nowakowskiella sp. JEL0078]